jgi:glycosyltransferase involved in cell wall biosynthesis
MRTVHFVYPHGERIATPFAIGRNVGQRLAQRYRVIHYDLTETGVIRPGPDDVLLGHPYQAPWTIFRRSARQRGWKRIIAISPFAHGDLIQCAFEDPILRRCDLYLAITGRYWFETIETSDFAHWRPKMVHLDLSIDRHDYPPLKHVFNPPGKRRFVYIGHTGWFKNTQYLSEIARRMPETEISWIGIGEPIVGVRARGVVDFATAHARQLVSEHDFLITVGKSDANPTTILEAMAWGLLPVCTPQSGYAGYAGIENVPLGDPDAAVAKLRALQAAPEAQLLAIQRANWQRLDDYFNWDRFTNQVIEGIESDASPAMLPEPLSRKMRLRWAAMTSPYSLMRPMNFARFWGYELLRARKARKAQPRLVRPLATNG